MCGGGGDVFQSIGDTLASVDPGPAIGSGLASVDQAVNSAIPGGWITVGALAGGGLALAYAPEVMALAAETGVEPAVAAEQLGIPAVDAATGEVVAPDVFSGLSANAPVDTTLSQAAADSLATGTTGTGSYVTPELMGPTYGELGVTGVPEGGMGPTYAEMGYTGLNQGEAIAAADAAAYASANNITLADAYKSLSAANTAKNLALSSYNLATGKGVPSTFSKSSGTGSYSPNISGSTTDGYTSTNLTPDLTKGNIDFTLMGAPTTTATTPQIYNIGTNPAAYTPMTAAPQQTPTFSQGGGFEKEPQFYSEGGLGSMDNRYVQGDGDGTSDSVNAKLADGEFVIPADVVAKLGNGSNNAGASVLDQFLSNIREHKQENGTKLEPDSKGPLAYLLDAKKKAKK